MTSGREECSFLGNETNGYCDEAKTLQSINIEPAKLGLGNVHLNWSLFGVYVNLVESNGHQQNHGIVQNDQEDVINKNGEFETNNKCGFCSQQ